MSQMHDVRESRGGHMSKKKSRMSTKGGSPFGWDSIWKFGQDRKTRDGSRIHKQHNDHVAHAKDERRQYVEAGSNWKFIRLLLDANKGLSLADAKRIASTMEGQWKSVTV
jgi:hypothetical protein